MKKTINLNIVGDYSRSGYDEFDPDRTVNMYLMKDADSAKNKCLVSRSGITKVKSLGLNHDKNSSSKKFYGRASHVFNNKIFIVIAQTLYFLDSNFNVVFVGELETNSGHVGMSDNGRQLMIVDGVGGWVYDEDTADFSKINDPSFLENPIDVTVLAQRFIVGQKETTLWGVSAINDATSWDSLDRAQITSYPTTFMGVKTSKGLLYLFGDKCVEVWRDSGAAFPYSRNSTQTLDYGCAATGSISSHVEYLIWLSRTIDGQLSVVLTDGSDPKRISNTAIEQEISSYENYNDATSYIFKNELGYVFYVINFTSDNRSWMYCLTTSTWSQIAYKDNDRWPVEAYFYYNDKHYSLSYDSFDIYQMSYQIYDDDGVSIKKMREFGVYSLPSYRDYRIDEIRFDVKSGIGKEYGKDEAPLLRLELSRDAGISFGNQISQKIGNTGKRQTKIIFYNLGLSSITVLRIENYNNVPFILLGCAMSIGV